MPSCQAPWYLGNLAPSPLASWLYQEPSPWHPWHPEIPEMRHVHQINEREQWFADNGTKSKCGSLNSEKPYRMSLPLPHAVCRHRFLGPPNYCLECVITTSQFTV